MKIGKSQLKQIIKEEINAVMSEQDADASQQASKMLATVLRAVPALGTRSEAADYAIRGSAFVNPFDRQVIVYVAEAIALSPKGGSRGYITTKLEQADKSRLASRISGVSDHYNIRSMKLFTYGVDDIAEFRESVSSKEGYLYELSIVKGRGQGENYKVTMITPKGLVGRKAKAEQP